jgi:hypothetical protein
MIHSLACNTEFSKGQLYMTIGGTVRCNIRRSDPDPQATLTTLYTNFCKVAIAVNECLLCFMKHLNRLYHHENSALEDDRL